MRCYGLTAAHSGGGGRRGYMGEGVFRLVLVLTGLFCYQWAINHIHLSILSLFCLYWLLVSDFPVLISTYGVFFHCIFSLCPFKKEKRAAR